MEELRRELVEIADTEVVGLFDFVDLVVEELLFEVEWVVDIKVDDVEALHPLKQPSDTSQ